MNYSNINITNYNHLPENNNYYIIVASVFLSIVFISYFIKICYCNKKYIS